MQNLLNDNLKTALKNDPRCIVDGELNKVKVEELALEMDSGLLKLLLADPALKKHFFAQIEDIQVFDKIKFQRFINNKSFLPDSYTAYKNKIGLTDDNGNFISESKEVVLSWPHKDCVLEGGQDKEDAKRDEIFFNEILAPDQIDHLLEPKVLTNFKKYDANGEHDVSGITYDDNLLIKGNNLLALHSLEKVYAGKVKLIYIDPPYNTENDSFEYNDRFSHSTWLSFMKNRLTIARDLLSEDGTIYIHLDYNEVHYCKILMDEIFGRDNFLNEIIWAYKERETSKRFFNKKHDTILFYAKNKNSNYVFNTDQIREEYSPVTLNKFKYTDEEGKKYRLRTKDGDSDPAEENENTYRQYLDADGGPLPRDWFVMPFVNQSAKERVFSTQKPEELMRRFILASTNENDLILDFFGGSFSTACASHKLNRKWISIEQIENQLSIGLKRVMGVLKGSDEGISKSVNWQGGGSFIYCELAKCNQNFIDQVMDAKDDKALITLLDTIKDKGFISYKVDKHKFDGFDALSFDDKKKFLIEVLDKNMLYVNLSEIEDKDHGISDKDIQLNRLFYSLEKQQNAFAE